MKPVWTVLYAAGQVSVHIPVMNSLVLCLPMLSERTVWTGDITLLGKSGQSCHIV